MNARLAQLTLLHVGLALITVFRAQAASSGVLILCALFVIGTHLYAQRLSQIKLASPRARTLLVAGIVLGSVLRVFTGDEIIAPGVELLLFLVMERSLAGTRLREQIQRLLLSCMLMVIAGVVHVGPDYPVLLFAFVLVAIAHLGVWNLQHEAERIGPRALYALRTQSGHFTRHVLTQNLRLGAGILASALLVFVFFPRIGAGVFFRGQRKAAATAGFRDEVALGHNGNISDNPQIVARIFPESPIPPTTATLPLYFRVSAFDRYAQGRWVHSERAHRPSLRASMHRYYLRADKDGGAGYLQHTGSALPRLNARPGWKTSVNLTQLRILQMDLGTPHLLLPTQPVMVEWLPRGALEAEVQLGSGSDEQVMRMGPSTGSMLFRAYARAERPTAQELRAIGRPQYDRVWAPYLEIPAALSPAFHNFAKGLLASDPGATQSQLDVVKALKAALSRYRYTTQAQTPSAAFADRDPVESFLLDTKAGHCEYFASALALLARSYAIPARVVNGYYGAHQNPVDNTYQIAQSQAHAWVEIYFGQLGWVRFDATPPRARPGPPPSVSLMDRLRALSQALETKYLEYVVDYDGKKQWKALKGLRQHRLGSARRLWPVVAALLLAFALGWRWKRRARPSQLSPRILRAQTRLRHAWTQRGLVDHPHENAIAWARRAKRAGVDPHGELLAALKHSEALRFSTTPVPPAQLAEILNRLEHLRKTALAAPRLGNTN